jgi:hypothetical protein
MRDEQRAFASTTATLRMPSATTRAAGTGRAHCDLQAVLLEGIEVVFIVLAQVREPNDNSGAAGRGWRDPRRHARASRFDGH